MKSTVLALSAIFAVALAGCSNPDTAAGTPTAVTSEAVISTPDSASSTTTEPSQSMATTEASLPYALGSTRVNGATDRVTYDVTIPQLSGGKKAVADEFNESMRASLQDQIDDDYGIQSSFDLSDGGQEGFSHIGRQIISVEHITSWIAVPPGAHGNSLISTVTIDADTAEPIGLGEAFTDLDAGLQRLSEESARILPTTRVGDGYEASGIAPTTANFANWTASPEGMNIHFGDYQVGAYALGLVTITVPWSALADLLAPGMEEVLSS